MLVITRRRSPLGFRTADERFISASEICEVFREGDSVRVDLRGEPQAGGDARAGGFFQFWTGNPATAGTIVRLLPTTRTIEYEGTSGEQMPAPRASLSVSRRRRARRRLVSIALAIGLVTVGALLVADIALRPTATTTIVRETIKAPVADTHWVVATPPVPQATPAEMASALAEIRRFDERMDGLRAQYRTASLALQWGQMTREEFVVGINNWLLPQWRAVYKDLSAAPPADGALNAVIRQRLMAAALSWDRGLQDYAEGLRANSYDAVIAAFERMSDGNESRREAWRMLDRAEIQLATPPASAAPRAH